MKESKSFSEFVYELENVVDEFVIVFLSFGAIFVAIWSIFFSTENVGMVGLGDAIFPWITMLALMIIARELWLMNARKGGEQ